MEHTIIGTIEDVVTCVAAVVDHYRLGVDHIAVDIRTYIGGICGVIIVCILKINALDQLIILFISVLSAASNAAWLRLVLLVEKFSRLLQLPVQV